MRGLCVAWAGFLVVALAGTSGAIEIVPCDVPCDASCAIGCDCGSTCIDAVRCRRATCVERAAAVGELNCSCRGSYKYPVPPQYTYHWPGMYSQPTMTEYVSPMRYQPFESAGQVTSKQPADGNRLVNLPPPPTR